MQQKLLQILKPLCSLYSRVFFSCRWSFLKINGSKTVVDDMALAKAAGMAEGAATGTILVYYNM